LLEKIKAVQKNNFGKYNQMYEILFNKSSLPLTDLRDAVPHAHHVVYSVYTDVDGQHDKL